MRDGNNGYSNTPDFDFLPLGQAIKKAREARGITREQLAEALDYAPRHIRSIENEGQHPSLQLFIQLVTMFDISVDQYIFPREDTGASLLRRELDATLNRLDDRELSVVDATAHGLLNARKLNRS
jgi:transcriptional regulator with XRE-family HTH domain